MRCATVEHVAAARALGGLLLAAVALSGCAAPPNGIRLPPPGAPDYQLGGAYDPPAEVTIVSRDRSAEPAVGVYSICYVNAFQTQPGEIGDWPAELLLREGDTVVFDPSWPDEALLDTSTDEKRGRIEEIVGPWIRKCADSGFDAVEFDNLDTYTRSDGALTLSGNLALAARLVATAHDAGLAAGQKNAAEDAAALRARAGFDFAVAEECAAFAECAAYTAVYGDRVIDIEYSDTDGFDFAAVCADPDTPGSVVLRDRGLVTPENPSYVYEVCG